MSRIAGLAWNSTAPWYSVDESGAHAKQAQVSAPTPGYDLVPDGATEQVGQRARRYAIRDPFESIIIEFSGAHAKQAQVSAPTPGYDLVPDGATEQVGQRARRYAIRDPFESIIIEFSDAQELQAVDVAAGFESVNKSVVYDGIPSQVVEEQLEKLLSIAHEEQFEVGIESQLSGDLQRLCAYDPASVLQSLRAKLIYSDANSEVLAEILRWASRQDAVTIRDLVVDLLLTGLYHAASLVRDAAALGLAYLDEDAAIAPLRYALEREKVPELREDLEDLIRSLEN